MLANRLSANGQRVLLLEAGGKDRHPWIHIPLGYGKLFTNATVNWLYNSEPEPACLPDSCERAGDAMCPRYRSRLYRRARPR